MFRGSPAGVGGWTAVYGAAADHGPAGPGAWLRIAVPSRAGDRLPRRWRQCHPHHARQYRDLRAGEADGRVAGVWELYQGVPDRADGACFAAQHDGAGDTGDYRAYTESDCSVPQAEGPG